MQQNTFPEILLNQAISQLNASEEFKAITAAHGYKTLADILRLNKPYDVLKHPGFGYRMLFEFTGILRRNGLGWYLD